MNDTPIRQIDLQAAAKQVMIENGFEPEFPPQDSATADGIESASAASCAECRTFAICAICCGLRSIMIPRGILTRPK